MNVNTLCVRDREGIWCSAVGEAVDTSENVQTVCGMFIVLPHGLERRQPTCPTCLHALGEAADAEPSPA